MTTGTILDYQGAASVGGPDGVKDTTRPSTYEEGIFYQAPWEPIADGFAEHSRRSVMALASTGEPVQLRSFSMMEVDDFRAHEKNERMLRDLLHASIGRYWTQVYQVVPKDRQLEDIVMSPRHYEPEERRLVNAHRVLYTVWERDRISYAAEQLLKQVGQAWVACGSNAALLLKSGIAPDRIKVVPVPHSADDPHLLLQGRVRRPGVPRFYHIGKWEPRKAQDKILRAFMLAFRPGKAILTMKTGQLTERVADYPQSPMEAIFKLLDDEDVKKMGWTEEKLKAYSSIQIRSHRYTEDQMLILHREGDVYVTLSRGEGFDMPAMDAKLSGNLMVYTPSGGPQDFAGSNDELVPPDGSVKCHPMYEWGDAEYLDFSVEAAVFAMRKAAAIVGGGHDFTPKVDLTSFRSEMVGSRMLNHLRELRIAARKAAEEHAEWLMSQDISSRTTIPE